MYLTIAQRRLYPAAIILTSLIGSIASPVYAETQGRPAEFLVTAYYSPVPHQCCYYRGSYDADIAFNGEGKIGADGTPVYAGMLAAPKEYPFGTRIKIEGLGVGTVHDRGGRIIETEGITRIDVWMGEGEEGLARALTFGARRMKGIIYAANEKNVTESISLDTLPAPSLALAFLPRSESEPSFTGIAYGETSSSVRRLQQALKDAGYFTERVTGAFGDHTQAALTKLMNDVGISHEGTEVDALTSYAILSLQAMKKHPGPRISLGLKRGARGVSVSNLQRTLRYLGYYKGRTDGVFSPGVVKAVIALQKDQALITSEAESGAGRIGPQTTVAIVRLWKAKQAKHSAEKTALKQELAMRIAKTLIPSKRLAKGDSGEDVRALQSALSTLGVFPHEKINAHFGDMTRKTLLSYQMDQKIISSEDDLGAGTFGHNTKRELLSDLTSVAWNDVRAGNGRAWGL